ncbi:MAG: tryptophan--tRNA ligase [Omnitrophica WOR_2 bacterium GWF2_43_52]|nr:MAG: tryptophan--tRNA ligase [Omnitrophica WOR_2 bacterium GWA2_44_7]OGX21972.1 MAG: tryptophan--tRNA ligase [Omnitrophica WOR_2 bacterium GWF2_43_52]OGX54123.1 MAG: tryptophan--tRNA ligase [Omnitrophica WOR_2 bacterium RIFOXYC2_FULL_43_9]HAH20034.1 tryptophan--tRNA ligase [Candidatus Omnitrophota bacterium]HBG63075.1 tryptophan--tRNA ligase [Candidatus Omnitrophota bacterium]
MKRILSGMRPTGKLHLGHLFGVLENWKKLQDEYECFFMVADWHALMSEYEKPQGLQETIVDNVVDWLACGISPEKAHIFIQTHIKEHLELYMALSLITPLGWLERCPTYKEQLREVTNRDLSTYGFLGYPVLQAADILLYKAHSVPVGEDQLPHLELTREISRRFNSLYKKEVFPEPQALLTQSARILGTDGRKMSKSYDNYIALSDQPHEIAKKIQSMFTDPLRIKRADPGHPDTCNVHSYYAIFAPERKKEIDVSCRRSEIGCTDCKKELARIVVEYLAPLQAKRNEFSKNRGAITKILEKGKNEAHEVAASTIAEVKELLGLR